MRLPPAAWRAIRRFAGRPGRFILTVCIADQTMRLFEKRGAGRCDGARDGFQMLRRYLISTSAFGIGQTANSNRTPLGLHRVAQKIGGGHPIGTVFRARRPVGLTWQRRPTAAIVHRIFWLEGLEPGFNRGGNVDTLRRYIYIHGFGDETTLGRPVSHGCIHVAASDLISLFDQVPVGALVWIAER